MAAAGRLRFWSTPDTFGSCTAVPFSWDFNYPGPHPLKTSLSVGQKKRSPRAPAILCDSLEGCSDKELIPLRQFSAPRKGNFFVGIWHLVLQHMKNLGFFFSPSVTTICHLLWVTSVYRVHGFSGFSKHQ